jgi:signal transduction histidine kinase
LKLQNKLIILTASILVGSSVAIGGAAIFSVQNAEMDRIDGQLAVAARAVAGDTIDPLATALLAADQSEIGLTVALRDFNGSLVVLAESQAVLTELPGEALISASEKRAVTIDGISTVDGTLSTAYRMRAVELASGDEVLLATSLDEVIANRDSNLQRLIWFILAITILGSSFVAVLIRRDMRKVSKLIEAAGAIADGKSSAHFAPMAGGEGQPWISGMGKLGHSGNAEIDELSRALERMVASLQHAVWVERDTQQAMQNFLGDASHELRTPLTVIKGYVEMLSTAKMTAEQKKRAFERVNAEVLRMQGLINDLLMLAELGESKPVESGMVDLSALVSAAVEDLKMLQPKRKVIAAIDAGLVVAGSNEYLSQLVANLFGNIRRHTPDDARVSVSLSAIEGLGAGVGLGAEADSSAHGGIILTVDDGGPGLPAESYARGISAFQRFDESRSRESGGSGLGMSIMAGIVRQHGGRIDLNQSPLGGLQTVIYLPL